MAREIHKLTALAVSKEKKIGLHNDGGGLYLRITTSGGKFWMFRYTLNGKAREMGLGALHAISLTDARDKAAECRKLLANGIDPINARDAKHSKKKLEEKIQLRQKG